MQSLKGLERLSLREIDVPQLLKTIDISTPIGLRDRALIELLIGTSASISIAIGVKVEDYFWRERRRWVRLQANGNQKEIPVNEPLKTYIDEYIAAAGILDEKGSSLFRAAGRINGQLGTRQVRHADVLRMIRRRRVLARTGRCLNPARPCSEQ